MRDDDYRKKLAVKIDRAAAKFATIDDLNRRLRLE
jgi:hypothetical protein